MLILAIYVDIMGLDNYWDLGHPTNKAAPAEQLTNFSQSLAGVVSIANDHKKLAALTECGSEAIQNPNFWTDVLLKGMTASDQSRQVIYVMLWRNATNGGRNGHHFYTPYLGHSSATNFVQLRKVILYCLVMSGRNCVNNAVWEQLVMSFRSIIKVFTLPFLND